jgi:hypothetical protein
MTVEKPIDGIVGRGMTEGAELFRKWFDQLTAAAASGEKTAYVFVMGSLCEVLRVSPSASPRSTRCRPRSSASRRST